MMEPILKVETDARGKFVERKNRFLGVVDIEAPFESENEEVHIRDPGRLNEILYKGNTVILKRAENEGRKTNWDLIAGKVDDNWIFVNSGYYRKISEIVFDHDRISPYKDIDSIIPEKRLGESVIDFLLKQGEDRTWIEIKGCTLAKEGVALFPDAPTARGKRHIEELRKAMKRGDSAGLIILVFRPGAECFASNENTDPEFADAFKGAYEEGLEVHPFKFKFEEETLYYLGKIPVC
ncbi:hypothetical protein AKJ57_02455 [candidate division MSBL1 archaeon SCGC-AAA259A05]|uniref:Sugar fermentation stimulation protein homolog n=1 Tax=candidate division MSBL1 archaeon SCGC-AAA259A05 TaxID=1698259 RepID=A0A133UA76_9EURY|nr:hypothetical protein AKJ57_02455 [candidate division MSBL1 archaeon SCGC-AAA259A05]